MDSITSSGHSSLPHTYTYCMWISVLGCQHPWYVTEPWLSHLAGTLLIDWLPDAYFPSEVAESLRDEALCWLFQPSMVRDTCLPSLCHNHRCLPSTTPPKKVLSQKSYQSIGGGWCCEMVCWCWGQPWQPCRVQLAHWEVLSQYTHQNCSRTLFMTRQSSTPLSPTLSVSLACTVE